MIYLEDEVLDIMRAATGIGGLCNVEVCESLLLHVRECYSLLGCSDTTDKEAELKPQDTV